MTGAWLFAHTIQIRSGAAKHRTRSSVDSSKLFPSTTCNKGLGNRRRDWGQNREPVPPAKMTAWSGAIDKSVTVLR